MSPRGIERNIAGICSPIRMTTQFLYRNRWTLILFLSVASFYVVEAIETSVSKEVPASTTREKINETLVSTVNPKVSGSKSVPENGTQNGIPFNKNITYPSVKTIIDNFETEMTTVLNVDIQVDHVDIQVDHVDIQVDHVDDVESLQNMNTKDISGQNVSLVKPEEKTLETTPLIINDTEAAVANNSSSSGGVSYSTAEPSTMKTIPSTKESYTSVKVATHAKPTNDNGKAERLLNNQTKVLPIKSEDQFSRNEINPINATTQATTRREEEYVSTVSLLNISTISPLPLAKFVLRPGVEKDPCMVATMTIQIDIQCKCSKKMKDFKMIVPENANVSGSCNEPQKMVISWIDIFNNTFELTLKTSLMSLENEPVRSESESISITEVSLKMKITAKGFPEYRTSGDTFTAWASNLNLFKSPVNELYSSNQVQPLHLKPTSSKMGPVTVTFTNVQFQAYISSHNDAIDSPLQNSSTSKNGAFLIGGSVAVFVIIMVISIVIYWKKRHHSRREFYD